MLVMEDLEDPNRNGGPMAHLDKDVVPPVAMSILVMQTLARFHGVWLSWFANQDPMTIGGLNKHELIEVMGAPPKFKKKIFFKSQVKMIK